MIWMIFGLLGALVLLFLLWPLNGTKGYVRDRTQTAMAIYEDQLSEVDRDAERGLITTEEARAAQVEIKRRMLATGKAQHTEAGRSGGSAVLLSALFVPLAALGLYLQVGAPDIPAMPFAERSGEQQNARELQRLVTELETRLTRDPNGGETRGWELLAQTYMNNNRFADAVSAFEQIIDRPDATSATLSQYAEALISLDNGVVTPKASAAIARAVEMDATNPAASFYRAMELDQSGAAMDARQVLLDRLAKETTSQRWMPAFVQMINQIGERFGLEAIDVPEFEPPAGPSAADVEAAAKMSPEERAAFIRSMVDGLEDRLEEDPGNLDGWLQLARALVVLGEQDRALAALKQAAPLIIDLPEDDQRRLMVEEGLKRFGQD